MNIERFALLDLYLDGTLVKDVYNKKANGDSAEYKKRLLSTFVDSIAVSNETLVI